jgi:hypothetical protein
MARETRAVTTAAGETAAVGTPVAGAAGRTAVVPRALVEAGSTVALVLGRLP